MPATSMPSLAIASLAWVLAASLASFSAAQQELVIPRATPTIDGELSDWAMPAHIRLAEESQVIAGKDAWAGPEDVAGDFWVAFDSNHLYLAGRLRDDQIPQDQAQIAVDRCDRIELFLRSGESGSAIEAADLQLQLQPLNDQRPWSWTESSKGGARQGGASLTGVRVVARQLDAVSYQFEASIPFHHLSGLRPGCRTLVFGLVMHDHDGLDAGRPVVVSWTGQDPASGKGLGVLNLPAPGLMVSLDEGPPLLSEELLEDLPYVLAPLLTIVVLFFTLRGWARVRARAQWLRPILIVTGVLLFGLGLWLPSLLTGLRVAHQREGLDQSLATLQQTLGKLEQGTLASYRGASRDRAVMDLLAGKLIARQRYTTYRTLAQLAEEQFGPGPRQFDDLPVHPYWIPLPVDRAESFQFDPPLHGSQLHLVLGQPSVPSFSFPVRNETPRLRIELDFGAGDKRTREIDIDRLFADAASLGREYAEACVVPVPLDRDLRALSVAAVRGSDLRLVGVSLQGAVPGLIEPLWLGTPSLGGVLTDLRGAYPQDAGIELAAGATARVEIPAAAEPPQKLWFFYRAVYPGQPTAIPGARVAEILLHCRGGAGTRSIMLEHQVSMFYELAVQNTRDAPPEGSPAAIALSWLDDSQERHVNLAYPVLDLPEGAKLEAIEFRNLAEYRMRFRSVVFGNERAAAPQDLVDAPIVREGQEIRLRSDVLEGMRDSATLIYRGGRLSEATLPQEQQKDLVALPRTVSGPAVTATETVLQDGSRRVVVFAPLSGDGWDGAVLGVTSTDAEWTASGESNSLVGFVLCLIGTPLLLVLLSELLAAATNLRFRLMAVLSVASLAPLGLLSLVLVQVIEGGHASDVQDGMRATVRSAVGQLDAQKEKVHGSARQWLRDLTTLATSKLDHVAEAQFAEAAPLICPDLQKLMAGQLPPEWGAGFLRLEWQPMLGAYTGQPTVVLAGDARMANVETPARLEPGVLLQWGVLMIGVRAEETVRGGTFRLTVGRPIDGNLLSPLAPGQVLLTDARGYPLAASGGQADAAQWFGAALDPGVMAMRERALLACIEERRPVVERGSSRAGDFVYGSEVLRDLQDTPRGLLVIAEPDQRATLELAIGRIPVRAFFLLVAGMLVVLAAFLSFVVSSRISRPIERLEHGALALSRGALDTRVVVDEGGQIGRLTRTFNTMAADLQGRLQDLQSLNRAMRDLSFEADEATTLGVLSTFCKTHTSADAVRIVLADQALDRLVVPAANEAPMLALPAVAAVLDRILGPCSLVVRNKALPAPWAEALPGSRAAVCLPIISAGRTRGVVLLGFEREEPMAVDLELLGTVVSQAAVALERAQLRRLAVQDPVTGVFTPEYFRRRTVDEVSVAQQRGQPLVLLGVALGDGDRRPRGLRRFIGILREKLPEQAVLCHEGAGRMQALLPGLGRAAAQPLLEQVFSAWRELVAQLPENEVEERSPVGVLVQFPDEASSTEVLFDALRERLSALHTPGAAAMESDESLHRAGVTTISPSMREVFGTLRAVAPTDLPVLLEGETGVGKEVLTNLVHSWSRRAGGPLVKVHCAALTETLLASELFGHEKGAFTGADRRKIGRFEQADGGTLFLDEVGDISLDVQVKLLRVLQEREVDRVGGTVPVKVDVRVITATNRDIAKMVADGKFRGDLYYRLQGMVVRVPPLRERKPEISGLVEHFRREVVEAGQTHALTFSTDAMDELFRREWPGNIRELRNTVYRAMVFARGEVVHHRDVIAALAGSGPAPAEKVLVAASAPLPVLPVPQPVGVLPVAAAPPAPAPTPAVPATAEPTFVLPAVLPSSGSATEAGLPERLRTLHALIVARGSLKTEDHMKAASVSHRTGLRDLQYLVTAGLVERVGTRRGTFYRPTDRPVGG